MNNLRYSLLRHQKARADTTLTYALFSEKTNANDVFIDEPGAAVPAAFGRGAVQDFVCCVLLFRAPPKIDQHVIRTTPVRVRRLVAWRRSRPRKCKQHQNMDELRLPGETDLNIPLRVPLRPQNAPSDEARTLHTQ